jgi:hypothetical protein
LQELANQGEQVIDLEQFANHKGIHFFFLFSSLVLGRIQKTSFSRFYTSFSRFSWREKKGELVFRVFRVFLYLVFLLFLVFRELYQLQLPLLNL